MTYTIYIRYYNAIGRSHDCLLDVTTADNLTVPEIKEKARQQAKRLFGNLISFIQIKILH